MNPWAVLGIEQTSKLEIIKNAYAEKSKTHHPEDDPEGFQQIHDAYRKAIQLAKTLPKENKSEKKQIKRPVPKFKRSFYIHKPDDNPARAKFYKSRFDEYSQGQLEKFKHENWHFTKSFKYQTPDDNITSIGKLPIKGAKRNSDCGGLNFAFVEDSEGDDTAKKEFSITTNFSKQESNIEQQKNNVHIAKSDVFKTKHTIIMCLSAVWVLFLCFCFFPFSQNYIDFIIVSRLFFLFLIIQGILNITYSNKKLCGVASFIDVMTWVLLSTLICQEDISQKSICIYICIIMCIFSTIYRRLRIKQSK